MKRIFQSIVFLLLCVNAFGAQTQTRLLLSASSAAPGDVVWAGVELKMPRGLHTYAKNPGDAGLATGVKWTLPPGITAGGLQWPTPEKLVTQAGNMEWVTYVYNDVVVLTAPLNVSKNLSYGTVSIKASVSWQECDDSCVEGKSDLQAPLTIADKTVASADADYLTQWRGKAGGAPVPSPSTTLIALLKMTLFAFLGGLILNIMPCVLPVISLKVLGFVKESQTEPRRLLRLGLVYGLGVLASFVVLAVVSIVIQRAGGVADWGMAFRNPQFRVVVTILILLVALNLFGLFEIGLGAKTMDAAGHLASKKGYPGAFLNGVLATVLATPCTAPFLSVALLFALAHPAAVTVWIFLSIGFGLSLPFVLICWKPRLLSFLPKPGVWMEQFKVAMGFPMLMTAVWLFSFTATRMGKGGVLWFGISLTILALAAWIWGQFVQRKRSVLAVLIVVLLLGFGYLYILEGKLDWRHYHSGEIAEKIDWKPWSAAAVEKARQEGHPVLVDFTADSCLNCQVNKMTSLEIDSTRARLREIGAVAFVADYTDENPAIAEQLSRYHRAGVPLVVVYPSQGDGIVLPPVLTPSIVLDALEKAAGR